MTIDYNSNKINIKRSALIGIEFIVETVFEFFSRNQKGKMKSIIIFKIREKKKAKD